MVAPPHPPGRNRDRKEASTNAALRPAFEERDRVKATKQFSIGARQAWIEERLLR